MNASFFIGKNKERDFKQDGSLVLATICELREKEIGLFEIVLVFEDGFKKTVDALNSLIDLEKIISL